MHTRSVAAIHVPCWSRIYHCVFSGESCLHIAIVYGNFELVKRLVECGADVNQRASGQFFLPEDQKRGKKKRETNYDGKHEIMIYSHK